MYYIIIVDVYEYLTSNNYANHICATVTTKPYVYNTVQCVCVCVCMCVCNKNSKKTTGVGASRVPTPVGTLLTVLLEQLFLL